MTQHTSKKFSIMKRKTTTLPTLVALAITGAANAATITTTGQGSAYTVSTTDLLQTSVASVSDGIFYNSSYNTPGYTQANLRDGVSAGGTMIGKADSPDYGQGGTVTFTLDLTSNTLGYDITDINTYTNHGDGGRDGQKYTVSYSLVGSLDFVDIASIDYLMGDNGTPGSGKVAISSIGVSGVDAIRFNFADQENAGSNFSELDVIGFATVPEPSAAFLGGLGVLALLRRRRA
jgi:PEP-CTERM motif